MNTYKIVKIIEFWYHGSVVGLFRYFLINKGTKLSKKYCTNIGAFVCTNWYTRAMHVPGLR